MPIDLRLLGRPRAERLRAEGEPEPVELPAKALALLGYLAANPAPQPRERILGLLWGESAQEAARKNLRNTLWTVRRQLGEGAVIAEGDRLALGASIAIDARALPVHPLEDPSGLLALYRGPFLDGLTLVEAPEFELWLTATREALAQTFFRRVDESLDGLAEREAWRDVVALARGALIHDPAAEGLRRWIMRGLGALGQRGEALREYESLKTALQAELGIEPSAETTRLRAELARPAPRLNALSAAPAATSTVAASESEPEFVGRAAERSALGAELAAARGGRARVALLTGELGIGKSRLWREWSRSLPRDSSPLETRCVEAASGLPFAPLLDMFERSPRVQALLRDPVALPRAWLTEVARLLPQLRAEAPDLPPPAALPPEEERLRVSEAFAQVMLALEARPLVVFVDDAHWADRATLDWLAYLVHRMRGHPLLLVLAYRPDEAPPALARQVAGWTREGVARRLPLARLGADETARLISGLRVAPALAHQLQARSAGNPYVLLELSRSELDPATATAAAVPVDLADLIRSRLERLSEPARAVLQAAAVLDPEFDLPLLTGMTGRAEDETLDALDELLAASVLTERAGRFGFNHPLLPQLVRQDLNAARAAVLSRRAAQALIAARGERAGPVAGLISDHLAAAGAAAEAARFADLAAEHAGSLAALEEAVRFRQRALELEPGALRSLQLGQALYRAGRLASAREAYAAALAEAERQADRSLAARACLGMGDTYLPSGWADEVLHWAGEALRRLDVERDPAAHAHAHFLRGVGSLRRGGERIEQAEADLAEAVRLSRETGGPVMLMAQFELGNARAERGDLAAAVELYAETAAAARAAGEPNQQTLALNNLAYHLMLMGETGAARERIEEALRLAEGFGLVMAREYLFSTRGEVCLAEGQWAEAERWIAMSEAEARKHNNVAHIAKCRANLARAAQGRGDLDAALMLIEEAVDIAAPLTARFMQTQLDLWLSEIYLARGEQAAASAALARAEGRIAGSHYGGLLAAAAALRSRIGEGR